MDQSCFSGFWKRRRPSSGKSKLKVNDKRSQLKESEAFPQEHYPESCPSTAASTAREHGVQDEKSGDTALRTLTATGLSSMLNVRRKASSRENVNEHLIFQNTAPRTPKIVHSPIPSFDEIGQQPTQQHVRPNTSSKIEDRKPSHSKPSRWLRRCVSAKLRHQRRPPGTLQAGDGLLVHTDYPQSPMPGNGIEPPLIPENLASGAAARAAAATGNEILESVRNLRLTEPKIHRDSESGIGIEMRDREEESMEVPIPRKG